MKNVECNIKLLDRPDDINDNIINAKVNLYLLLLGQDILNLTNNEYDVRQLLAKDADIITTIERFKK